MASEKFFVVIEQPIFFPWCGYLGLISISDIFVFYDDVQFERRSWQSRNRIISSNKEWEYINVPTKKASRDTKINEVYIVGGDEWKDKIASKLNNAYRKAPYYSTYYDDIMNTLYRPYQKLVDLDITLTKMICEILNIDTPNFMLSSEIEGIGGAKTDRLVNIMNALGEKTYLSATGAKPYIEAEKFRKEGMSLMWYEFIPKQYDQNREDFISHMSVVDALFNIGAIETKRYIQETASQSVYRHIYDQN